MYTLHTNFCTLGYMNKERMLQDNIVFWVILPSKVTFGLVDFKIDGVVGLVNVNLPVVDSIR